jgi:transposase-like protein
MEMAGLVERVEGPAEGIGGLGRLDLRRRCEREQAERVLGRASFLPRRDELLLRAVLEDGIAVVELARLAGVCPRAMRGRVKRLLRRMSTPRFVFVAARIGEWTSTRRRVAEAYFLHGLSMREVESRLGLSRHQIRFHRDAVEVLFQMEASREGSDVADRDRTQVSQEAA